MSFPRRKLFPNDNFFKNYKKKDLTKKQMELKEMIYGLSDWNNIALGGNITFRKQNWTKVVNWFITEVLNDYFK